jgi:hypothetical protein
VSRCFDSLNASDASDASEAARDQLNPADFQTTALKHFKYSVRPSDSARFDGYQI